MAYPFLLVHGIARFDILGQTLLGNAWQDNTADGLHYFRHIGSFLEAQIPGLKVFRSDVGKGNWAGPVGSRAAALREFVQRVLAETQAPQVHIIAHSMGGLDARHMLFDNHAEKLHEKVASVATISTPHLGTAFADWGIEHHARLLPLAKLIGLDIDGVADLTRKSCERFNAAVATFEEQLYYGPRDTDHKAILFATYAGVQPRRRVLTLLRKPYDIIHEQEGDNDGLVSLTSAKWQERFFDGLLDADHLNELGWFELEDFALKNILHARSKLRELEAQVQDFYLNIAMTALKSE